MTRRSRAGRIIGPDERVDCWESPKALAINAAWQLREEKEKGTIEAGKLADLVILDGNLLAVETDDILKIQAVETLKQRETVYERRV